MYFIALFRIFWPRGGSGEIARAGKGLKSRGYSDVSRNARLNSHWFIYVWGQRALYWPMC